MSQSTNNFGVTSQVNVGVTKQTDHKAIEGTNKGDYRGQAQQPTMPPQDAPRAETTNTESAGS